MIHRNIDPRFIVVRKIANEVVNNSNVFQSDNHLKLDVSANSAWAFNGIFWIGSDPAADIKFKFTTPAGTTGYYGDTSTLGATSYALGDTLPIGTTGVATPAIHGITGIVKIGGTPGTLQLQWAQNTAQVADTTLYKHSVLKFTRVS